MSILLLIASLPSPSAVLPLPPAPATSTAFAPGDEEYDRRLTEAGKDPEALWDLYQWCVSTERDREGMSVLRRIVRAAPDHKQARELLGHISYDGQWFTTEKKLEAYKKKEAKRRAKELGLIQWKGDWVHPDDVSLLEAGFVRDPEGGQWILSSDLERREQGWVRQDLTWIPPDEVSNIEQGLYKVDDRWMAEEDANDWHSQFSNCWKIPDQGFVLWTTLARKDAERAALELLRVPREFERLLGRMPTRSVPVVLFRDVTQYDEFCNGEFGPKPEMRWFSRLRQAFLTETWLDVKTNELRVVGAGIWDTSDESKWWMGLKASRLAFGLSLIEALDPSPKAIADLGRDPSLDEEFVEAYFAEKSLPDWIRWGVPTYVERYFIDNLIEHGANERWAEDQSLALIHERGGLLPLEQVFAMQLATDTAEARLSSERLIDQSGLLMAFTLDGGCDPVIQAHHAFKEAFRAGDKIAEPAKAWEQALAENEEGLRKYAQP